MQNVVRQSRPIVALYVMYRIRTAFIVAFTFILPGFIFAEKKNNPSELRPLEIVFCLDLSGSTNGLISDLRDNLWNIVNHLQALQPEAQVRLGVVGFSRPSFGKENAYVKVLVPLTANFDQLDQELYRLKPSIEKGDQYVGYALRTCVMDMQWTKRKDARKMVFLVGNGTVADDRLEYLRYCEEARSRNIVVHTFYVLKSGNLYKELPGWRRIATITGGSQTEIVVNKPDDLRTFSADAKRVEELNHKLNVSMYWVGPDSSDCRRALHTCDSGASHANSDAFLHRVYYKLSANYRESLTACEVVSRISTGENNGNPEADDEYHKRLQELAGLRAALVEQIRKEYRADELTGLQQQYKTNQLPDNSLFTRCVLNILYKVWQ